MAFASASARLHEIGAGTLFVFPCASFEVRQQILNVPVYRFQQLAADGFVEPVFARSHQASSKQPQRFGFGSAGISVSGSVSVGVAPAAVTE